MMTPTETWPPRPIRMGSLMFFMWMLRAAILAGGFAIHWALGVFLVFGLVCHMNHKAHLYNQRYNLGLIKAPWYRF